MKLTRRKRIVLELLGPPLIGALPIMLAMAACATAPREGLLSAGFVLLAAYAFAGIQSILYTSIMEWRFARGLDPRHWRSVRLSALLGLAAGLPIVLGYGSGRSDWLFIWLFWPGIGSAIGFLMGLLIKAWSPEIKNTGENRP